VAVAVGERKKKKKREKRRRAAAVWEGKGEKTWGEGGKGRVSAKKKEGKCFLVGQKRGSTGVKGKGKRGIRCLIKKGGESFPPPQKGGKGGGERKKEKK